MVKPSLLEACIDVIEDESEPHEVTNPKPSEIHLSVEYIKSSFPIAGRSCAIVTVEESMRRQQDVFGQTCQLRQPDLRREYALRVENPLNYDSDSSMSENEEFEIDSKSAPSLSLSRKACGYYKRYDVGFTDL